VLLSSQTVHASECGVKGITCTLKSAPDVPSWLHCSHGRVLVVLFLSRIFVVTASHRQSLADLLVLVGNVLATLVAFDFLDHLVDGGRLLLPLALAHLELLLEQLVVGLPVASA
jgi:hypothetical protein